MRCLAGVAVALALGLAASAAHAEQPRPRTDRVPVQHIQPTVGAVVNSKTIFINRCKSGCRVFAGFTDSRTNKSSIGQGTLSEYKHGDSSWNSFKTCMTSMFSRFNVTVTDVDPGANVDHFEVMVAGTPGQIGLSSGIGGIAEYSCTGPGICSKYLPNALVFAFANVYPNSPLEICATAAQELAHTWSLDHAADPSDPMTYFNFSGMRSFKDNVLCGSDCFGSQSPLGQTCTNGSAVGFQCPSSQPTCLHTCMSTGTARQNDVQILTALFGPAGAIAPTLKITNPTNGSTQDKAGFPIMAECTSTDGAVQEVNLSIDGAPKASLTAPPFNFMAPALPEGPHKISVLCASTKQAITTITHDVLVGTACVNGACSTPGYVCFDGACIAGPEAPGGLGAPCSGNADCLAGACASDGMTMACVIPCDLESKNCPDGFGCIEAGTSGVCWLGADDGGGCCDTSGDSAPGSLLLAMGLGAILIVRRRRR